MHYEYLEEKHAVASNMFDAIQANDEVSLFHQLSLMTVLIGKRDEESLLAAEYILTFVTVLAANKFGYSKNDIAEHFIELECDLKHSSISRVSDIVDCSS